MAKIAEKATKQIVLNFWQVDALLEEMLIAQVFCSRPLI
jgi:hypothetical protein